MNDKTIQIDYLSKCINDLIFLIDIKDNLESISKTLSTIFAVKIDNVELDSAITENNRIINIFRNPTGSNFNEYQEVSATMDNLNIADMEYPREEDAPDTTFTMTINKRVLYNEVLDLSAKEVTALILAELSRVFISNDGLDTIRNVINREESKNFRERIFDITKGEGYFVGRMALFDYFAEYMIRNINAGLLRDLDYNLLSDKLIYNSDYEGYYTKAIEKMINHTDNFQYYDNIGAYRDALYSRVVKDLDYVLTLISRFETSEDEIRLIVINAYRSSTSTMYKKKIKKLSKSLDDMHSKDTILYEHLMNAMDYSLILESTIGKLMKYDNMLFIERDIDDIEDLMSKIDTKDDKSDILDYIHDRLKAADKAKRKLISIRDSGKYFDEESFKNLEFYISELQRLRLSVKSIEVKEKTYGVFTKGTSNTTYNTPGIPNGYEG